MWNKILHQWCICVYVWGQAAWCDTRMAALDKNMKGIWTLFICKSLYDDKIVLYGSYTSQYIWTCLKNVNSMKIVIQAF